MEGLELHLLEAMLPKTAEAVDEQFGLKKER
jgi:hypothetical protein